jgi:phosphatidylglycerophosphate synthase
MPTWVRSDLLTGLGFLGAGLTFLGFWLASDRLGFLWLALAGLALNWFGDSLDGSLARFRNSERPQYGFFLDHTVDSFAMALVATGIGLSPLAHFWCALLALGGYYIIVIVSFTTCLATGVFKVSFANVGPTEIRLGIVACTVCAALLPIPVFRFHDMLFTIYDGIILVLTTGLVLTAALHAVATARQLAEIDPPHKL